MKLLKIALATMEVVRQLQVLFRERAQPRIDAKADPQASTQTLPSNRRRRR